MTQIHIVLLNETTVFDKRAVQFWCIVEDF